MHYESNDEPKIPASAHDHDAAHSRQVKLHALDRALSRLVPDSDWLLEGVTNLARSLTPVVPDSLTIEQEEWLIRSDTFTRAELEETRRGVARGLFQLGAIEMFLGHASRTLSLDQACGFLGMSHTEILKEVSAGRLCAATIGDALRFPEWQFDPRSPSKRLPGLPEVIAAASAEDWMSLCSIMQIRQEDLVGEGPMTPAAWLSDGGPVGAVVSLLEDEASQ